ncbi:MAG: antibiotic biosynthesis monooxygenase [Terricaulis sp.]
MTAELIQLRAASAPKNKAVCAIVRAKTHAGLDEEFEAQLRDLAFHIEADEDACTSYVITRALGSRDEFAVHARFVNWRAFRQHAETEHLTQALPRLTALLARPVSLEIFFEV